MTIKERIGFATLTLAAAFVGGAVSGHIFAARTVDAANAPRMITAQKFMLVDSHGKTRGEFNVTRKGVAQLAVFDGAGALRAGLGVGSDGAPALGIYGHDGKPRVEVGLTNSVARVVLFDADAKPQATIGVAPDGQSGLGLMDKNGNPRAFLRRNGMMIDLNTLLPANSPIYALVAQFINASGEIAGLGVNSSGQTHAFLATPCP